MSRRRYTEEEKRKFLADYERSGVSVAAYCREHGLAYQTLASWRRARKARKSAALPAESVGFVEVEVQAGNEPARQSTADPAVELVLAGGSVLRIYPSQLRRP